MSAASGLLIVNKVLPRVSVDIAGSVLESQFFDGRRAPHKSADFESKHF